ncbi:hypothetical protein H6G91_06385 [Nostoc muscorum FACHB-395]|nr:hypothetical protein [Desmonostoc muscorum FACHB-395]
MTIDILTGVFALGVPVRAASPSGEGYARGFRPIFLMTNDGLHGKY